MILVFGGSYNGKLDFVKEEFNINDDDILNLTFEDMKIDFSKKVINSFHKFTYSLTNNKENPLKYILDNEKLFKDKIIICDDISEGIVPLKKEDRVWRENNGRCLQYLSKNSNKVYRVFCGISTVIKGE